MIILKKCLFFKFTSLKNQPDQMFLNPRTLFELKQMDKLCQQINSKCQSSASWGALKFSLINACKGLSKISTTFHFTKDLFSLNTEPNLHDFLHLFVVIDRNHTENISTVKKKYI